MVPRYENLRQGLVGWAAEGLNPILAVDVRKSPWKERYCPIVEETRSELAVPILDQGKLLGVLNLEHPRPGAFTNEHLDFVRALAIQAAMASRIVDLYREVERSEKPVKAIREIAGRILDAPTDPDTILSWVLTGVTSGEGLGFSRGMILLADPISNELRGHLAVGPFSGSEARPDLAADAVGGAAHPVAWRRCAYLPSRRRGSFSRCCQAGT